MYQVVGISKSPERRFAITTLDSREAAKAYLDGMNGNNGEVVDIRTGLLKHEKVDGVVRDVLKPTARPIL